MLGHQIFISCLVDRIIAYHYSLKKRNETEKQLVFSTLCASTAGLTWGTAGALFGTASCSAGKTGAEGSAGLAADAGKEEPPWLLAPMRKANSINFMCSVVPASCFSLFALLLGALSFGQRNLEAPIASKKSSIGIPLCQET
jgi:hypothetical protein